MREREIIEQLTKVLEFYADPANYLYCQNRFLEYGERNHDLQSTNVIGHKAREVLNCLQQQQAEKILGDEDMYHEQA